MLQAARIARGRVLNTRIVVAPLRLYATYHTKLRGLALS
jgi:hypothetical protein